jgi:hypothetical protein
VSFDFKPVFLQNFKSPLPPLEPSKPLIARFEDSVELLGYNLPTSVHAGESLIIRCYWRILKTDNRNLYFTNQLFSSDNKLVGQNDVQAFAPSQWPADTIGISTFRIKTDNTTPTGPYRLLAAMYDRDTLARLPVIDQAEKKAGTDIWLGPIKIIGQPRPAPQIAYPQSATFADQLGFAGSDFNLSKDVQGDTFDVTLFWSARGQPSKDYTVFVHLLDKNGKLLAQHDAPPDSGRYPTSLWDAGETISDTHHLKLAAGTNLEDCKLSVGFYDPANGKRVPVLDRTGQTPSDCITLSLLPGFH